MVDDDVRKLTSLILFTIESIQPLRVYYSKTLTTDQNLSSSECAAVYLLAASLRVESFADSRELLSIRKKKRNRTKKTEKYIKAENHKLFSLSSPE